MGFLCRLLGCGKSGGEAEATKQFEGKARLPASAVPSHYDIHLKPDLVSCKFTGSVSIDLEVVVPETRFIVLNAADVFVHSSSVSFTNRDSAKVFKPLRIELKEADEILVLQFEKKLPVGKGILTMDFHGFLNDKMEGFYKSTYELNGKKKNMAVTQFEAAHARRCFPCWDEPAFKATFKITLLDVPSDLTALSNMPIDEENENGKARTISYKVTPVMSTYLVAVVIGEFDYVEEHLSDGMHTKVRVYCQVGKANKGKFALDVAVKALRIYEQYFGIPYALPKMDMVAIPDFAAGAMENYGLVTYREARLLFDDQHSAAANKQDVAIVVAHELAHQWFGNLVTMEWWTDLWLNEGFATWMSYHLTDTMFPQWKIWNQFLDISADGLRLDALEGSHPIEVEVNHASEADQIFDAISYKKGASVVKMLHSYLGDERFQRSIASYIKRYAGLNTKTDDLWAVLEEGSDKPVKKIMDSWTKQKGFPVVSVKVEDQQLILEQSQFLLSGSDGDGHWDIPITLCCGPNTLQKKVLLDTKSTMLNVTEFLGSNILESRNTWIKLNEDQTGFYRVKYDGDLMARLIFAIKKKCLPETDKFGILDDSFALCIGRHQSLTSLLTLMDAYRKELEFTVVSKLMSITYKVESIAAYATPELLGYFKQFFIDILYDTAEKLGWDQKEGEGHLDAMLRGEIRTALAFFGHGPTLTEASRRFQAFSKDRSTPLLPPDIRKAAYVAVMQKVGASNRSGYESLLKVFRESDLDEEKARVLSALATCPDPQILQEFLNFLLSSEVRSQDAVCGLGVRHEGHQIAWAWLKGKWDQIWKTFGSGPLTARFVSATVSPLASFENAKEVEKFFASRGHPSYARTLKQSIEQVNINAKWVLSIQKEEKLTETVTELAQKT